jgi:alkylation response protein AidB-like acyl-CoA dehydrogenase
MSRCLLHMNRGCIAGSQQKDAGMKTTLQSSMAKLYTSEVAVRVANECVQIHGGYGFIKDYPAEKFYRDVKLCTIGEGTNEIQRLVIARQLLEQFQKQGAYRSASSLETLVTADVHHGM